MKKSDKLVGAASWQYAAAAPTCGCGQPGASRWEVWNGVAYVIHDPCEACATANRQRLDLLLADNPSTEVFFARLMGPKS